MKCFATPQGDFKLWMRLKKKKKKKIETVSIKHETRLWM